MDYINLALTITIFLNILLGLTIFLRNSKNAINLSLASFSFSLAIWAFGIEAFRQVSSIPLALVWAKTYYISGVLISVSLLYFALVFPEANQLSKKKKLLILIPAFVQAALLTIPSYLTQGVVFHSWGKEVILNKIEYALYTAYFVPYFYGALYVLWRKYRSNIGILKKQVLLVLLSILVASLFGVTFNLILPWFGNSQLIYFGPPSTMTVFWGINYAIIRHRLLDYKATFAKVVARLLLTLVILGLYSIVVFAVSTLVPDIYLSKNWQIGLGLIYAFLISITFPYINKFLIYITNSIFHGDQNYGNKLLSELASVINSYSDNRDFLNSKLIEVITKEMNVNKAALLVIQQAQVLSINALGFSSKIELAQTDLENLIAQDKAIYFDELPESATKEIFRKLDITLSRVLKVRENIVGLLLVGDKLSGERYETYDFEILDIIASEVSIILLEVDLRVTKDTLYKMTQNMYKLNTQLHVLDKLKDDFVSVTSHELRTPMTAIRSYAWMALNRPDIVLSDKMKKYLSRVLISTERLINLVNDMLNISRIESGRVEITPRVFDIVSQTQDVLLEVEQKARDKNVHLELAKSDVPKVFADVDKVHQVLLNLIGNSLKFTPVDGRVYISFFTDGKVVEVSIKDTGVGISKDDLSRLFKKFGRLDNTYVAAATSEGTGLGLYISKSLIELMGGKIWASSEGLGKGSVFSFALPMAKAETLYQSDKDSKKSGDEAKMFAKIPV